VKIALIFGSVALLGLAGLSACDGLEVSASQGAPPVYEGTPSEPIDRHDGETLFGISPFPGGFTTLEQNKAFELARLHGNIYVVQRDNGVPWAEAYEDIDYPRTMMSDWENFKRRRPSGSPMYLALAPLNFDRETLIDPVEGSSMPPELRNKPFDHPNVKRAYLNHVRRAVEFFDPDYLNIGVESGELSHRNPSTWPAFVELFRHVRDGIKADHPDIQIGISWGLQSLMQPEAAEISRSLVDLSDFVGISFYPYMSEFHEAFGTAALPDPPGEWRIAFDWLRNYTDKPIAICETGYNSTDASIVNPSIQLGGSEELQVRYIQELASISRRDDYLFVIWYFSTDITNLIETMGEAGESVLLWRENGLVDKDFNSKPALQTWSDAAAGMYGPEDLVYEQLVVESSEADQAEQSEPQESQGTWNLTVDDLVKDAQSSGTLKRRRGAGPDGADAARWDFTYGSDWSWIFVSIEQGALSGADRLEGSIRSNKPGGVIIQLKEASGESFFTVVNATKSWKPLRVRFDAMSLDESTRKNGRLDPGSIVQIMIADGAGAEGKRGSRRVFVSEIIGR